MFNLRYDLNSYNLRKIAAMTTVEPPVETISPQRPVFQNTKSQITISETSC